MRLRNINAVLEGYGYSKPSCYKNNSHFIEEGYEIGSMICFYLSKSELPFFTILLPESASV